ncbi:MAG: DUF58 domain-containing protein [Pseudomonadota bacterium]
MNDIVDQTFSEETVAPVELDAHGLSAALPELLVDARRVAQTVIHGIHGRRRAGPGETFWQFRQFGDGDTRAQIDWRRSGASDHLFIREREWEAAQSAWLWLDLSASMGFRSRLSDTLKRDRALVLGLALGALLSRGGERVGLLGAMPPRSARNMIEVLAQALLERARSGPFDGLPVTDGPKRHHEVVLIGDFLSPPYETEQRLAALASTGVNGHLVQIVDPAEETLPYSGRVEFLPMADGERVMAERVDGLREAYQARFAAHRRALRTMANRFGWSFLVHHTDRPAGEALLTLSNRIAGSGGDYRSVSSDGDATGAPEDLPLTPKLQVVR